MWPNPQLPADSVTFTEEILNEKFHFLCNVTLWLTYLSSYFTNQFSGWSKHRLNKFFIKLLISTNMTQAYVFGSPQHTCLGINSKATQEKVKYYTWKYESSSNAFFRVYDSLA